MKLLMRICFIFACLFISCFMWLHLNREDSSLKDKETKTAEGVQSKGDDTKERKKEKKQLVHIKRSNGKDVTIELEEYLIGVVGSEMPASFAKEALKAQAVAARTFVAKRNFEVDDTTASQVFQDDSQLKQVWKESYDENKKRIEEAVTETQGEVLTYQGELITAAFFSSCNGYTNNSEDYWSNSSPYLRSVESAWDKSVSGNKQTKEFSLVDFSNVLGFQNTVKSIGKPEYYKNGYVKSIVIDGIKFSGREIREALSLRSSAFEIKLNKQTVHITTEGFGHGIGMSQYGAKAMAEAGYDYKKILKHYYTDVEITAL